MMTVDDRAALEKLFTQSLASYGVLQFNINALQKDGERMFKELEEIKNKLEIDNAEKKEQSNG